MDAQNNFYFIEVNARIQVEHPVTEMVTSIDLVQQQIRIAAGEPLAFGQEDVVPRGHAIECRINSEDPENDFRPSPGKVTAISAPRWARGTLGLTRPLRLRRAFQLRLFAGQADRLGASRLEAIVRMRRALDELQIEGVKTTIPLHRRVLRNADFVEGHIDTTWVERVLIPRPAPADRGVALSS